MNTFTHVKAGQESRKEDECPITVIHQHSIPQDNYSKKKILTRVRSSVDDIEEVREAQAGNDRDDAANQGEENRK
jgi:hypothetical protein